MTSDPTKAVIHKRSRKLERKQFTSPGHPGEALRAEFDDMLEQLRFPQLDPPVSAKALAAVGLEHESHYFLVPAFFRFVQHLHASGTSFNLVFRTFGFDLERIGVEFNAFCEGRHPFFPLSQQDKMDGSNGGIDRRLRLQAAVGDEIPRFGTLFRSDTETALIMGTFEMPEADHERSLDFYADKQGIRIIQGLDAIHQFLTLQWRETQATLAIRDYYPYWASKLEHARAGKLITIDPEDTSVHSVLFDDNILEFDAHIADVRRWPDGASLPFDQTRERYLMRVEPIQVIYNREYFIERLETSLQHRDAATSTLKN